jgi:hypothetical protein
LWVKIEVLKLSVNTAARAATAQDDKEMASGAIAVKGVQGIDRKVIGIGPVMER